MRYGTHALMLAMMAVASTTPARGQNAENKQPPRAPSDAPAARAPNVPSLPSRLEIPDDEYIPVARAARRTAPAVQWTRNGHVSVQVNVTYVGGQPQNIVGDAANEPSIAVDPTQPNRMAIGWRQFDTVASNFRQAGWGYTGDGGRSWTFPGVIDPGVFRSDPVLDADADGNLFYNSLTASGPSFSCNVYKSTDGGMTWDAGAYAYGGDKQWMTIDRTGGIGRGNIYAFWTAQFSACFGSFTRSYDGGQTFLACSSIPGSPQWGTLAVGPDGELYIAGNGFKVVKSTTLQDENLPVQFDFNTTVSLDGTQAVSQGPNPGGLLGQAWIAVDHSTGPTRGNVYLLCSVDRSSTSDPLDVMFSRSTDGGQTWSAPVRVNDDPGNSAYQWFGTMSVAPNGRIDVIWNDTRNDPGGYDSELYYAYSTDAGVSWSANEALSPAFDPHVGWPNQNKIGDYYDMVSDRVGANLAYAATFNGEQDVYYLRIGDYDCNDNGTGDSIDIAGGSSLDCNSNEIPDECESIITGDFDGDGHVKLSDYAAFSDCFTGPCDAPPCDPSLYADPCCAVADYDQDEDLDLDDFAAFQAVFTAD